jgi:hypothetical protein
VRLTFDRGTVILSDLPAGMDVSGIVGVLWDARVGAHRAPARLAYTIASDGLAICSPGSQRFQLFMSLSWGATDT